MREALGAFGFIGKHFPALLLVLAPWLIVSIGLAVWPDVFPDAFNAMAGVWLPLVQPLIIPGPLSTLQALVPLWVPQVVAFCGFAVAWQRHFMAQGTARRRFASAWLIYTGLVLAYLAVLFLAIAVVGLGIQGLIPPDSQRRFGIAILALTVAAGLIIGARLSPALAAAALGDRLMTAGQALQATRRRSGDLGIGLLICWLPSTLVLMGLFGTGQVLGAYAAAALRVLVWMVAVALSATFISLVYVRVNRGRAA